MCLGYKVYDKLLFGIIVHFSVSVPWSFNIIVLHYSWSEKRLVRCLVSLTNNTPENLLHECYF